MNDVNFNDIRIYNIYVYIEHIKNCPCDVCNLNKKKNNKKMGSDQRIISFYYIVFHIFIQKYRCYINIFYIQKYKYNI